MTESAYHAIEVVGHDRQVPRAVWGDRSGKVAGAVGFNPPGASFGFFFVVFFEVKNGSLKKASF